MPQARPQVFDAKRLTRTEGNSRERNSGQRDPKPLSDRRVAEFLGPGQDDVGSQHHALRNDLGRVLANSCSCCPSPGINGASLRSLGMAVSFLA